MPPVATLLPVQRQYFQTSKEPKNQLQGIDANSLCSLAGRYDNHIPTRFLAPIGCYKDSTTVYCMVGWVHTAHRA
jgi:hypothetical protein